jgi:hypothetical protein
VPPHPTKNKFIESNKRGPLKNTTTRGHLDVKTFAHQPHGRNTYPCCDILGQILHREPYRQRCESVLLTIIAIHLNLQFFVCFIYEPKRNRTVNRSKGDPARAFDGGDRLLLLSMLKSYWQWIC